MAVSSIAMAILLLLQSPAAPAQSQFGTASSKASIEGVVRRIGSDEPVADAEVTIFRTSEPKNSESEDTPGRAPLPPVRTDRQGKFVIGGLDAGSYRVIAARNGYVRQEY